VRLADRRDAGDDVAGAPECRDPGSLMDAPAVEVPADLNADIEAGTVNGGIETDFPITVRGRFMNRRMSGRVGSGGRTLEMETVNGSIRLRKTG